MDNEEEQLSSETIAQSIPLPIDLVDPTNDDDVLKRTQDIRMRMLSRLVVSDDIHHDPKMLAQLDKFLTGADKQVFSSRKLKLQERGIGAAESVAATLDRYVEQQGAKIERHNGDEPVGDYRPAVPNLPSFQMKDGELDPVGATVDVEEIIFTALENKRPGMQDQD